MQSQDLYPTQTLALPQTYIHHEHHEHATRQRSNSGMCRVSVEFFNPEGVQQPRRTLTQQKDDGTVHEKADMDLEKRPSDLSSDDGSKSFDFEKLLKHAIRKRQEGQIKPRHLGIVFRDLKVVGVGALDSPQPTLGSVLNPFVAFRNLQELRHPTLRTILSGFEGVVKPGEMILVLGSPGSGCTTFLKTLANQRKEYHAVKGSMHYDSFTPSDLHKHFRGDIQYCPEDDVHFPTLTVEQTLNFAAAARTPKERVGLSRGQFQDAMTDMLTTVFGLRLARKIPVGDNVIMGISGGEKKRVSIAEALAARSCIGAWDNSTRGLDASTALEFVKALRIATDTLRLTTIVSIYQAGESLYEHFDKLCVIYEGRMAYFGPASEAKQYFMDMGYEPANRQTTADFLVAVTDPRARIPRPGFTNQPRTAAEFAQYFLKSPFGIRNKSETEDYEQEFVGKPDRKMAYIESARAEFARGGVKSDPYMLNIAQQVKLVMRRRVQVLRGNMLATWLTLFSFVSQGLIIGSVFYQTPETTSAFFSRGGVLFFGPLFAALTTMAEIPSLLSQRPIVLRHELAAFYHPFIEALAMSLVDIPITLVTSTVFSIILYFLVGLQRTALQFFIFLLFVFIVSLTMKSWFRSIASAFRSEATATSVAGISVLVFSNYTGFAIPKPTMTVAFRWITYINPLKYGFESIMTNEFRTLKGKCSTLVPQGPGYENVSLANQVCATVGALPGQDFVDGARFQELAYGFSYSHTWMNFGIVIAFGIVFTIALLAFTELNTTLAREATVTLFKRGPRRVPVSGSIDEESTHAKSPETETKFIPKETFDIEKPALPPNLDIFSWQHIDYYVPVDGGELQLLSDVSGYVALGKLTALMGESGAGKTTLLNVLASRTSLGVVRGDRFVNGQGLPADFQAQSGYCQQMDTHVPFSTVREALLFSAKLRRPPSVPLAEKEAYVDQCLKICGLEAYADASVGSLNTEHKKRTTIGVELAAKPKLLLFLDEPTSGLDSQSAWAIMSFLRSLADQGQAILCTIHQPSAELFQVFDRLLLLKKGGETVFFGDVGRNATTLINYFETNGARPCLPSENPAEYMLDVIGAGATATSSQDWHTIWQNSPESKGLQREIDSIHADGRSRPSVEASLHSEFATSWPAQAWELIKRDAEAHWRDPTYLIAKLSLNMFGGLFIGLSFFKSDDSQQGTQNKLVAIFMAMILSLPLADMLQVPFINMRKVYEIRERQSRMYSWTALLASQIMVEIPWNILGSMILFFCWYWPSGFDTSRAGYTFLMLAIVYPTYYTTFGQAIASMVPSAEIAALLFSFFFSFVIICNGVLQPYRQLGWWQWMYHLSPYTYLVEGILGQAIGHQQIVCSAIEFVTINPPAGQTCASFMGPYISRAGGYLTNPGASSACEFCSFRTTDEFLRLSLNIFYDHRWRNFGFMICFIIFNIVLIFTLTFLFRIRTGSLLPSFKSKPTRLWNVTRAPSSSMNNP